MTFQSKISTETAIHALMAMDGFYTCSSCGHSDFTRKEMAFNSDFIDDHVDHLEAHFGGKICDYCANYTVLNELTNDCDHQELERHGWEQV